MTIRCVHMSGLRLALEQLRCGADSYQAISTLFGIAIGWLCAARGVGVISWDEAERLDQLVMSAVTHARSDLRKREASHG